MARHHIDSIYLSRALDPVEIANVITAAERQLKNVEFDAIAFRGMSGALIAPIIAYLMHKSLIMVRKPKTAEPNHSGRLIEGDMYATRYVIIDDCTSTGQTVNTIHDEIRKWNIYMGCRRLDSASDSTHTIMTTGLLIILETSKRLRLPWKNRSR